MNLARFTRRLEECRRRWHRLTLKFVLETARILLEARDAAGNERRWCVWIRDESRITRTTAYRYLRVAEFVKANVPLMEHFAQLSIVKIYDLARLDKAHLETLIRSGKADSLNDVAFHQLALRIQPRAARKPIRSNLYRSLDAAFVRLERTVKRWQHAELEMPVQAQMKLKSRLQSMIRMLNQIGRTGAAAM